MTIKWVFYDSSIPSILHQLVLPQLSTIRFSPINATYHSDPHGLYGTLPLGPGMGAVPLKELKKRKVV
jgi:hypothetical protein